MANEKPIKVLVEITLKKGDGPHQDELTVIEQLLEDIENIQGVYVQDEDNDEETKYEIETISQVV